jgi:hypothetical protein
MDGVEWANDLKAKEKVKEKKKVIQFFLPHMSFSGL